MLRWPVVSPFHESADSGWRRVKNRDAITGDDAPEAVWLRPVRGTLVHECGRAVGQDAVDDVTMPSDPADVGGTPERVLLAKIEDVFGSNAYTEQVSAGGVKDPLGFSCRATRIKNEKRMFAVDGF